ncbi:hypothetical protein K461DRAFT_311754 [Myriangium duriaei CBS 260.36]|uniref:Peptidase S33 tripeptidyl aminopeptidase-like C-terminal domain-containing protein n=1 Tax=Myriangium duriaei CBS 260.36 TaxID=1168546 RepID=A0A9P4J1C4_9PEZI|nr:hypothetical protein K461DRAFT_311754 [Myriangium duriaei CBS 260.36]
MCFYILATLFALTATFTDIAAAPFSSNGSSIEWITCGATSTGLTVQCGGLEVPQDYQDAASGKVTLKLVKVLATVQPSKGSIIYNPGGPGEGGRADVTGYAGGHVFVTLGGQFDVISWDPRGTGDTLPYSCFQDSIDRQLYGVITPQTSNSSDTAAGRVWALKGVLASACADQARDYGELVGTAYSARDLMQIVDALGEDGLLRYWGVSYGSILGMTAAAMFPDRTERVVVDGILNPHDYYHGTDSSQLADTDAVFAGFLSACIASRDRCPLAKWGLQSKSLSQQVFQLLDQLKSEPIVFGSDLITQYLDYDKLKPLIFSQLYDPLAGWPQLASLLDGLFANNGSQIASILAPSAPPASSALPQFPDLAGVEARLGIRCSDTTLRADALDEIQPLIQSMYAQSALVGDYLAAAQPMACTRWPFTAKERVETDWNVNARHPLLFVGNTFDPVTPLASAWNASSGFVGSSVLVHNGYGHSSLAQPSLCTAKHIRKYFTDGTLPPTGTVCQTDVAPFTNESFEDAFTSLNGSIMK